MNKLLSRYFELNFFLIPIRKNSKLPLFKKWNRYSLSYNEAKQYLKQGYNLAVVAKDFYILDYDRRLKEIPEIGDTIDLYRNFGTLVQFSPHGFHVYYKGDFFHISSRHPKPPPQTVRHGDMYALVAPSKIDSHSYWWLDDMKGEILTL